MKRVLVTSLCLKKTYSFPQFLPPASLAVKSSTSTTSSMQVQQLYIFVLLKPCTCDCTCVYITVYCGVRGSEISSTFHKDSLHWNRANLFERDALVSGGDVQPSVHEQKSERREQLGAYECFTSVADASRRSGRITRSSLPQRPSQYRPFRRLKICKPKLCLK